MRSSWTRLTNAFDWKNLFPAKIRPEDTLGREAVEAYDDWRRNFITERLANGNLHGTSLSVRG
jgi:hypothetical protein